MARVGTRARCVGRQQRQGGQFTQQQGQGVSRGNCWIGECSPSEWAVWSPIVAANAVTHFLYSTLPWSRHVADVLGGLVGHNAAISENIKRKRVPSGTVIRLVLLRRRHFQTSIWSFLTYHHNMRQQRCFRKL